MLTVLDLIASLAVLPAALGAQTRRGAQVLVTLTDGAMVEGELIAVKTDSFLLLNSAGTGESIALAEIQAVRVLRKSKAALGALVGVLAGGAAGALYGHHQAGGDDEGLAMIGGIALFGGIGGLLGLGTGITAGLDTEFVFAGQTEKDISEAMASLRRQARRPAGFVPPLRAQEPRAVSPPPGAREQPRSLGEAGRPRRPRFRITWSAGYLPGDEYSYAPQSSYSFRFLGDVPPAETGVYSTALYMSLSRPEFSLGSFSLAYEWTRRSSVEVEVYRQGDRQDHRFGDLQFTASVDGLNYWGMIGFEEVLSGTALLAGVTFRPIPPDFLRPHVLEFGVAAGPAFMTVSTWRMLAGYGEPTSVRRICPLALRGRAAYDYYFVPALSLGAYVEYRRLRATIPAFMYAEDVDFYVGSLYTEPHLKRTVELTVPGRTVDLSRWTLGLRLGVRF